MQKTCTSSQKKLIKSKTTVSKKAKVKKEKKDETAKNPLAIYVNSIWQSYDLDGNGVLDREEAKKFVKEMMSEGMISSASNTYDEDGELIDFDESGFD